ncbi:MAG: class I SAM-dependent methyltransferase [Desulfuromonadales bacterium]
MISDRELKLDDKTINTDLASRWTETFVTHSRNRLIHRIRYYFYERAFFGYFGDKNARILDVGCGSGEFITLLMQRGYKNLYGVEIDDILIDMAAGSMAEIKKSSVTELPYADGSFDCIYMFNVMHHLRDIIEYEQALAEMSRCLRDGGRIILVEPCRMILYRMLKSVCYVFSPFSKFFRNFHVILQEEWVNLTYFLNQLDALRQRIYATRTFTVLADSKLLHQWITVIVATRGVTPTKVE